MDYSIRVSPHLDRDEIMEKLGFKANENYRTGQLKGCLAKHLKDRHPIHKKLRSFSDKQLMELCVSLLAKKIKGRDRKLKAISNYFFKEFPDAPLTNLERIMEGDNAGLTSIIFNFKKIFQK